ncbi:putative leucine-rich repeat receptor-like protein kinase [Capsicum galapagoense]
MWNGPWYVPELRVLNLSNNSLISIIPPAVGNATKLLNFSLSGNKINGNIPKKMSSNPATLFNISSLLTISLSFNSLSGPLMLDEENIVSNLKIISLAKNKFSGCISSNICQLTELKVLSLPFNNITGKIPKNIGCLSKLKMFYIGQILKAIFNISTFEAIAFSFNNLSGRIPTTTGLHHLKFLLLGNNQIEGEIPLFIANASKLEILELANNFLTGTIPINLGNLQEQRILILHDNLPTNELRECELRFFNSLTDCRILQYLDVGSKLLNGVLPNSIGNLSSTIELIHLGDAHISGFIPTSIGNMSGLSALVFQQNHLMGNIPPEIEGEVPSDIGKLKALIYLDLSANHFSGMIPTTLGELQNLEFLDLSNNSFSGPILLSFVNLIILEFLGLSLNALSEVYVECTYWRFSLPDKELKSNKLVLKIVIPAIVSIFLISLLVSIWIMKQPKKGKSKDVEQAPEIRTHQLVSYHEI